MVEPPQRVVPGAPPPAPLSKSQKKKRKGKKTGEAEEPLTIPDPTSAALIEKAPEPVDVQGGAVAPELVSKVELPSATPEEEISYKPSPIVELINKRLKATAKKITRVSTYAAMDAEKLNDDQKRTMKTLPALEIIQKELGEVKKVIEAYELDQVHELALKRAEAERTEKRRLAEAVAEAEKAHQEKTSNILSLLRLQSLLAAGQTEALALNLDEAEVSAIFAATEILLGEDEDAKEAVLRGLFSGDGGFHGTTYGRLLEITHLYLSLPREATPLSEDPVEPAANEEDISASQASIVGSESEAVPLAASGGLPGSGSFHFMQASEIETPFEDNVEWVEKTDAEEPTPARHMESATEVVASGHVATESVLPAGEAPPSTSGPLDWAADDEGGLPSIAGLQAKFGTSGSATPVDTPEERSAQIDEPTADPANGIHVNGAPSAQTVEDDDGFTQARVGRGGRGRGARGASRAGSRGNFRGNGEFRGGDRGLRGGYRGGFRGGERGGERGGFRGRFNGEWRGDGEFRGRGGRSRARGDRGGVHGGSPVPT